MVQTQFKTNKFEYNIKHELKPFNCIQLLKAMPITTSTTTVTVNRITTTTATSSTSTATTTALSTTCTNP